MILLWQLPLTIKMLTHGKYHISVSCKITELIVIIRALVMFPIIHWDSEINVMSVILSTSDKFLWPCFSQSNHTNINLTTLSHWGVWDWCTTTTDKQSIGKEKKQATQHQLGEKATNTHFHYKMVHYAATTLAINPEEMSHACGEYLCTHFKNMHKVAAALTGLKLTKVYSDLSNLKDHKQVFLFWWFSGGAGHASQEKQCKATQGCWSATMGMVSPMVGFRSLLDDNVFDNKVLKLGVFGIHVYFSTFQQT
jgi:hypothetical protein